MHEIAVPTFARLDDYYGPWSFEPDRFLALWERVRGDDVHRHMAAARAEYKPGSSNVLTVPARGGKSVARVLVRGTLMKGLSSYGGTSTVQLRRDIRQAANSPDVSAILLDVDSPGGTAAGTEELAAEVAAARRKKPVWAHIDDLGASAAYWVASQADQVYANNAMAAVGSIGTVLVVYDYSRAAEADGIRVLRFATGALKGAGFPGTAVTDEQQAAFQARVDNVQEAFDAAVRRGRGLSAAELAAVRTGGVFSAAEAVSLKLIDGIRPLERTLDALANAK